MFPTLNTLKMKKLWSQRQTEHNRTTAMEIYYYSSDRIEKVEHAKLGDIHHDIPEWATNCWINIDGLDEDVVKRVAHTFELHPLAIEDVIDTDNRPKIHWYDTTLFLLTTIVSRGEDDHEHHHSALVHPHNHTYALATEQVSFFLTGHVLITIQEGLPGDIWQSVRQGLDVNGSQIRSGDAAFLLYSLLVGIVDTCDPIMDELDDILEDLEMGMLTRPTKKMNRLVYAVKRQLMTLRTTLLPTRKIIQKLILSQGAEAESVGAPQNHSNGADFEKPAPPPPPAEAPPTPLPPSGSSTIPRRARKGAKDLHSILTSDTLTYFRDLLSELTEMAEKLEHQREMATSLSTLYSEHQAQLQGDVSYVIALTSVFFLPLTFIAGVYGMNFDIMPELRWKLGYLYVWLIFLGVVLFEVVLFWRVGWISFGSRIDKLASCQSKKGRKTKKRARRYYTAYGIAK